MGAVINMPSTHQSDRMWRFIAELKSIARNEKLLQGIELFVAA